VVFLIVRVGGSGLQLFDFDHIHFDSSVGSPVAILYGALGTVCFKEFHDVLVGAAKEVLVLAFCLWCFMNIVLHYVISGLLHKTFYRNCCCTRRMCNI